MIRRLITRSLIIVLFLIVAAYLAVNLFIREKDYRSPSRFGSYPEGGLYTYNPETIFESLQQGEDDIFTPYFGSPDDITLYYDPVTWSQSDYLKIATALVQKVWGEPSNSKKWNIESVYFAQSCVDSPKGFNRFHIVYYQDLGVTNWKRNYTTRLIDIQPWRGLAYWGGDATFSSTLVSNWKGIDLDGFQIVADDALKVADDHGGGETDKSYCNTISVNMDQHDKQKWNVSYFATDFGMRINANSGKYEILSMDK